MADWDVGNVYYSYQSVEHSSRRSTENKQAAEVAGGISGAAGRTRFGKFLMDFSQRNRYLYREKLMNGVHNGQRSLSVSLDHVADYDEPLATAVRANPDLLLSVFEIAAGEISARLRNDADAAELAGAEVADTEGSPTSSTAVQVVLTSTELSMRIRELQASDIGNLVRVSGIVISAAKVQSKAVAVRAECRQCRDRRTFPGSSGVGGVMIPRTCQRPHAEGEAACPMDPYVVLPDDSSFVDQQWVKLQELPEEVPTGEIPRAVIATVDRALAGQLAPGMRVSLLGIYSVFQSQGADRAPKGTSGGGNGGGPNGVVTASMRTPYVRSAGLVHESDSAGGGRHEMPIFDLDEEEQMQRLVRTPDLYNKIVASIAPEIYGFEDVKRAVACQLFGGTRKLLPDGVRIRGDINVLLLGDPSTAKSQLLKFVEKVAPISVYTSGKGSSAAGLTASVIRDKGPQGDFRLEGGAMVLADGGVVCIDEFDKMRIQDSVAIHEAMEQQTISIAKAGITSVLNARTSVLAAANPVFGRFDDTRPADENIDFQTTILSRFDLIFLVRDVRNDTMDYAKAQHVLRLHRRGSGGVDAAPSANLTSAPISLPLLRRFITYARARSAPRLTRDASALIRDTYVRMRQQVRQTEGDTVVPITVRQLESLVRITEALAKMTLSPVTTEQHVNEAVRLFKVATLDSVNAGAVNLDGRLSEALKMEVERCQEVLQRRLPVGSSTSRRKVVFELRNQTFSEQAARLAIDFMSRRGDLELRRQRKVIYRVR